MEFHKLDLTKASIIKREVDIALQKLALYSSNNILNADNVTNNEINRSKLFQSIQFRIQELENFGEQNGDDERIILFEKEKLRLRKALMQTTCCSHGTSSAKSITSNNSDKINTNNNIATNKTTIQSQNNNSEIQTPIILSKSVKSINSTMSINTNNSHNSRKEVDNLSKSHPIYTWEAEGNTGEKHIREPFEIDGNHYIPSSINGFYHNSNNNNSTNNNGSSYYYSERFIDFQIILTEEELTTLAARKKQASVVTTSNKLSESNKQASTSVHASTPYIDPRRAIKDMLRPTNPEKWMDTNGLRPYQKRSFNLKS